MTEILYRHAVIDDAADISRLILESQRKYCFYEFSIEGRGLMGRLCGVQSLTDFIDAGDLYWVAVVSNDIVGVAGITNNQHLRHNFVDEKWQRRGLSNGLWSRARDECLQRGNPGFFDLQSSTYAIAVYEKWGFIATAPVQRSNGLVWTPMQLKMIQP